MNDTGKKAGVGAAIVAALAIGAHKLGSFFHAAEKPAIEAVEHLRPGVKAVEHLEGNVARDAAQAARKLETPGARQAAEEFSHTRLPGAALHSATALSESQRIGQRLSSLKVRIPPVVYARLFQQWQRNHAEIEDCHQKLQDLSLSSYERDNLQERLVAASQKNEEIERLMAQYG
jgi:hypothetical protein